MFAHVEHELVVAVGAKPGGDGSLDAGAEVFLRRHHILAKYLVEDFLVQFARHEAGDFLYLETEVCLHTGGSLLVNLQQGSQLSGIAVPCGVGIEYEHVVHLSIGEDGLLLVVLHVRGHHHGAFHLDAAFLRAAVLVQFGQQAFQHIVVGVGVHLVIVAVALGVHLHLHVHHFVGHVDVIVVNLVVLGYFRSKFGSQSHVEYEIEVLLRVEVNFLLRLFVGHRFAQDVHVVLVDIIVDCLGKHLVHFFQQYALAIHFLHQAGRHHTFAETRHLHLAAEVFQSLVYLLLIICFLKSDGEQCVHLVLVF